ncbi:MAG: phage tail sheath subtilisin-like domain-containing protein [Acidobacteriota bacterium]|nr:phage tail sheath subtilisin-like domain-containing protein [Acidobacteriota bacterium]
MPITPTYPGVYVEEIPSGVRTITGVATSVTAFIGSAKRGPIDRAVRVLGFADYERRFGGLSKDSEMSYAVRQFFNNGGGEAWIVRVEKGATNATIDLDDEADVDSLRVTARDAGSAGNFIRIVVDYDTANPASTFNLTAIYLDPNDPAGTRSERFDNLSMNSADARFVETAINDISDLITVDVTGAAAGSGTSVSGVLTDPFALPANSQFRIVVNGGDPVTVNLNAVAAVGDIAAALTDALPATVTSAVDDGRITLTSVIGGEKSSIRVLPGTSLDASVKLKLGTANGGTETDAAAGIRPARRPIASIMSAEKTDAALEVLPDAGKITLDVILDNGTQRTLTLLPTQSGSVSALAQLLQTEIRKLDNADAYRGFKVTTVPGAAPDASRLVFTSGSKSSASAVAVTGGDLQTDLGFDAGSPTTRGDAYLSGGSESPLDVADPYAAVIASRTDKKGLYALENVDLFNILCLPGITHGSTLADATTYCQERRAFFIIDPPAGQTPDQMESLIAGPTLPKSSYAAIYYPKLKIGDPLSSGALRTVAPSGTIAGVFARTDATRGVWKAPAGTEATLNGVQAAEYVLTDRENGVLNPHGVNCARIFPVYGPVAWGARTLRGDDAFADEWKYIPVRRLALYLEESLYRGTQWVVFEPNDEPLWAQIRLNVGAFMQNLFRQGAFQGRSPREAYLVKCDRETTTQNDINLGIVNILVGFAPLKPAEFVFLRIQQLAGQIQT